MSNHRRASVSIVIPTLNPGHEFVEVLGALKSQSGVRLAEIIVIDSGSEDGTIPYLRSECARLIEIPAATFDHGLTRNRGIQEATGEIVTFLTQDAVPVGDSWLRSLVECFEDPLVAGAYSRQLARRDAPPFARYRLEKSAVAFRSRRIQSIDDTSEWQSLSSLERLHRITFDNVSSSVRRRVALEIPFRRADFGEDLDWSLRVLLAGYKIVFEPRSVVVHSHDRSMWYEFKRVYKDHQNLNRLIGLETTPSWRAVVVGGLSLAPELLAAVPRTMRQGPIGTVRWRTAALCFAFSQLLAQYLGARSARRSPSSVTFRLLERLVGSAS